MRKGFASNVIHSVDKQDISVVLKVLKSDWLSAGSNIKSFEEAMAKYLGVKYVVALSSGTAALDLSLKVLDLNKYSEVIISPLTFVADANVVENNNLSLVLSDINKKDFCMDYSSLEKKINKKTKVIIATNYNGKTAYLERIRRLAKKRNLFLIEDAAHSLGSSYKKRKSGTKSDLSIFSLHPTKTITCGEGGFITTNNKIYYEKLLILRNQGLKRNNVLLNWDYDVLNPGLNYRLTDFQAALANNQLKKIEFYIKKRREIYQEYLKRLKNISGLSFLLEEKYETCAWFSFPALLDEKFNRNKVFMELKKNGINVNVYYKPIHHFKYFKEKYNFKKKDYANTEHIFSRLVNFPITPNMKLSEVKDICNIFMDVLKNV